MERDPAMSHTTAITGANRTARVGGVKARRTAAFLRAAGLDASSGSPEGGICVMAVSSALASALALTPTGWLVHERRTLMRISTTIPTISIDIVQLPNRCSWRPALLRAYSRMLTRPRRQRPPQLRRRRRPTIKSYSCARCARQSSTLSTKSTSTLSPRIIRSISAS